MKMQIACVKHTQSQRTGLMCQQWEST